MLDLFGAPNATSPCDCILARTRDRSAAHRLIARWHSTLPSSPPGERLAFIAYAPNLSPVAVALWGRPTARAEDQTTTLQLTRLAHAPEAPRNLGSWMLGQMRRWIRHNRPEIHRLITYHDADHHHGTIYRADNWQQVHTKTGTQHDWTNRPGRKCSGISNRIKWERKP